MAKIMKAGMIALALVVLFSSVSMASMSGNKKFRVDLDGRAGYLDIKVDYKDLVCTGKMWTVLKPNGKKDNVHNEIDEGCIVKIHPDAANEHSSVEVQFTVSFDGEAYTFHGYFDEKMKNIAGWYRITGRDIINPWYGQKKFDADDD